jgi:diacylglycerol kinase (ATP)
VVDNLIVSRAHPALIFVNPSAGEGKAIRFLPRIRRVFEEFNIPAEFLQTNTAQELATLARKAVSEGRKLLIVMGGDGTFQELVNATYGADVLLGVLPLGGGNDFAAAVGLPKTPVDAVRKMLGGEPRGVDLIKARTADGVERLYVGGGGAGLDAEAAQYAGSKFRHIPGRLRYVISALTALWNFKPLSVAASFPESELPDVECRVLLSAVLNTPTYGAGIRLAPAAVFDDGWLDVVLVQDLRWTEVLLLLPRLVVSGELRTPRVTRVRAKRVRFTADRPCVFHADGEVLGAAPIELEVMPKAVRVLTPLIK